MTKGWQNLAATRIGRSADWAQNEKGTKNNNRAIMKRSSYMKAKKSDKKFDDGEIYWTTWI